MAPSGSSIWGLNQQARTSPSALGMSLFFIVLDHPKWVQAIWSNVTSFCPMDPLGPQKNWAHGAKLVLRDSNSPYEPRTAAYRPWTSKILKWEKIPVNPTISIKWPGQKIDIMDIIDPKWLQNSI
ncbi:hypothetical protein O181_016781 [Austropuccinia psidii MF-1]|uniref:Uncharacterized protein n=1 Tax=Austropuccinia psidii MF-1 TaxID=1389203 RepID=A0A9Q3C6D3_9BASI|nr:hypothetical protein [Austropuccinia psidii MF-1]